MPDEEPVPVGRAASRALASAWMPSAIARRVAIAVSLLVAVTTAVACVSPRPHRVRIQGNCAACHMNDFLDAGLGRSYDGGVTCAMPHLAPLAFPQKCGVCHDPLSGSWCGVAIDDVVRNHVAAVPGIALYVGDGGVPDAGATPVPDGGTGHTVTSVTQPTVLAQCVTCHVAPTSAPDQPDWTRRPTDCASCHVLDRDRADQTFCNASTGHGTFSTDPCGNCHRPRSWWPAVPGRHVSSNGFSSGHGGSTCQRCHNLDLLGAMQPDGGVLDRCVGGAVVQPGVKPSRSFAGCNQNNTCPECDCATCHDPVASSGQDGHRSREYAACVAAPRPSICFDCHTH